MKKIKRIIFLLTFSILLSIAAPAYAADFSVDLNSQMPGLVDFEQLGVKLEISPGALSHSGTATINTVDPNLVADDRYCVQKPFSIEIREPNNSIIAISTPIRVSIDFDLNDYRRASNLNTNLPVERFRIGYMAPDSSEWQQLPSQVFWNGISGVVEAETDWGSGRYAILWSKERNPVMSQGGNDDLRLMIDYKPIKSATPYVNDGRTMVPLRVIAENLGAKVFWDNTEQRIDITLNNDKVKMWIGNIKANRNAQTVYMDVAPEIVDSRTYVPLRFVSESFGAKVTWDGVTRTVYIVK